MALIHVPPHWYAYLRDETHKRPFRFVLFSTAGKYPAFGFRFSRHFFFISSLFQSKADTIWTSIYPNKRSDSHRCCAIIVAPTTNTDRVFSLNLNNFLSSICLLCNFVLCVHIGEWRRMVQLCACANKNWKNVPRCRRIRTKKGKSRIEFDAIDRRLFVRTQWTHPKCINWMGRLCLRRSVWQSRHEIHFKMSHNSCSIHIRLDCNFIVIPLFFWFFTTYIPSITSLLMCAVRCVRNIFRVVECRATHGKCNLFFSATKRNVKRKMAETTSRSSTAMLLRCGPNFLFISSCQFARCLFSVKWTLILCAIAQCRRTYSRVSTIRRRTLFTFSRFSFFCFVLYNMIFRCKWIWLNRFLDFYINQILDELAETNYNSFDAEYVGTFADLRQMYETKWWRWIVFERDHRVHLLKQ